MLNVHVQVNLSKIFMINFHEDLTQKMREAASLIVLAEYKQQIPVDKGLMRRNASTSDIEGGALVDTIVKDKKGRNIAVFVARGTGKHKGAGDTGYTTGWTRKANYTEDDIAMFAAMAKRGVIFSQWPNMFDKRTVKKTIGQVNDFINNRIKELSST